MKDFKSVLVCLMLATLSSHISCKHWSPQLLEERRMMVTREQAVQLAKAAFMATGFGKLENYTIAVEGDEDPAEWCVFFESAAEYPIPGDHMIIYVDKRTRKCIVAYGE